MFIFVSKRKIQTKKAYVSVSYVVTHQLTEELQICDGRFRTDPAQLLIVQMVSPHVREL